MSPKDFRKISHLEPKILNSLVNWSHTDTHTHTHTDRRTSVNLQLKIRGTCPSLLCWLCMCKKACMHATFWCTLAPLCSMVLDQRDRGAYGNGKMPPMPEHIMRPEYTSYYSCITFSCVHRPMCQPNWVRSDRYQYFGNQEKMLVM